MLKRPLFDTNTFLNIFIYVHHSLSERKLNCFFHTILAKNNSPVIRQQLSTDFKLISLQKVCFIAG